MCVYKQRLDILCLQVTGSEPRGRPSLLGRPNEDTVVANAMVGVLVPFYVKRLPKKRIQGLLVVPVGDKLSMGQMHAG